MKKKEDNIIIERMEQVRGKKKEGHSFNEVFSSMKKKSLNCGRRKTSSRTKKRVFSGKGGK